MERDDEMLNVLPQRETLLARGRDGPVVHIGQIHDLKYVVPAGLEPTAQQILEQKGSEIPDVRVVVNRGSAGVERDPSGLERLERLQPPAPGIEKTKGHQPPAP